MADYFAGFDPGSRDVGWCLIRASDGAPAEAGVWRMPTTDPALFRLGKLAALWRDWGYGDNSALTGAALETQWVGKNAQSGLMVARSRGWLEGWLAAGGVLLYGISPTAAKLSLTGDSKADKKAMVQAATLHGLDLSHIPAAARHNAADAFAIAREGWAAWNHARLCKAHLGR